jgi:hypothetical protein
MAHSPAKILESIPGLAAAKDAAALVALQDHADKQVRKAVRTALHALRSKGVAIPDAAAARSWTAPAVDEESAERREVAVLDPETTPGLVRIMIAVPQADQRGFLWVAALTGRDQIADFTAYVQTDGQRSRLAREWSRSFNGREVPADWARARVRWAREQTLTSGYSVPNQLDDMLVHLGPAPAARPTSFLIGKLPTDTFKGARDNVEAPLLAARVFAWPPLFDVEPLLKKVNEANPDMSAETPEDVRYQALMSAAAGDESLRSALKEQCANLLEDAAHGLWLGNQDSRAAEVLTLATELRSADAPETLPWVGRLLGFQIASTLSFMQRQQAQQQQQQQRAAG